MRCHNWCDGSEFGTGEEQLWLFFDQIQKRVEDREMRSGDESIGVEQVRCLSGGRSKGRGDVEECQSRVLL